MLLKAEIVLAIEHTHSNAAAARYLGVHIDTYRKYATMYGLYVQHKNMPGKGVIKNRAPRGDLVPLNEILDGLHPTYARYKFLRRLFLEGYMPEVCMQCGFEERRITDYRVPLILTNIDGNKRNFKRANLQVLCFNCYFLTVGDLRGRSLTKSIY